jgi:plasmid stability protein
MSRRLTIRGVPDDVAARLEQVSRERGQSMNTTVTEIIAGAVGMDERLRRLQRYVAWSEDELEEFSGVLAQQRTVDADLWR